MTYAPKIQDDFALNQIVVHLALVTRSIAGPGNQAMDEWASHVTLFSTQALSLELAALAITSTQMTCKVLYEQTVSVLSIL